MTTVSRHAGPRMQRGDIYIEWDVPPARVGERIAGTLVVDNDGPVRDMKSLRVTFHAIAESTYENRTYDAEHAFDWFELPVNGRLEQGKGVLRIPFEHVIGVRQPATHLDGRQLPPQTTCAVLVELKLKKMGLFKCRFAITLEPAVAVAAVVRALEQRGFYLVRAPGMFQNAPYHQCWQFDAGGVITRLEVSVFVDANGVRFMWRRRVPLRRDPQLGFVLPADGRDAEAAVEHYLSRIAS